MIGVVMVSASFPPHVGGAEKQALELSAALAASGEARVKVATRRFRGMKGVEDMRGLRVHRLWRVGRGGLDAATFLLSLCWFLFRARDAYSVIHVHLAGSPAVAAAAMGRALGKKVIVKLGGGAGIGELAVSSRTALGQQKLRLLRALEPKLIAVASELAEEAKRFLGEVDVEIVPNGVETTRYKPVSAEEKSALRRKLGWPQDGLVFLYTGRLSEEKRLPWFVDVWAAAMKGSPKENVLVLAGSGKEELAIRTAAAHARFSDRVRFVGPTDSVEELYAAADVFVLPSISEGLSNSLLEAMSSGLAVLASRVGGTPEAVEDGKSALLFPPMDAERLRTHLGVLLAEPGRVAALGRAARERALERYALEKTVSRCLQLYAAPVSGTAEKH